MIGGALENFITKKCFQTVFLSVQCCGYSVLYEYSSKKNLKIIIFDGRRVMLNSIFCGILSNEALNLLLGTSTPGRCFDLSLLEDNNFIMSEMSINSVFRRLFAFLVA